jgi:hypothetical protein
LREQLAWNEKTQRRNTKPTNVSDRVVEKIQQLADDFRPSGVVKLKGFDILGEGIKTAHPYLFYEREKSMREKI